jgi:general secretion pathway protein K
MTMKRLILGSSEYGIALIAVLWVCALVSVLAAGFTYILRTETQLNIAQHDRARARAGAEAGIQRVLAMLTSAPSGSDTRLPLQQYTLRYDDMDLEIKLVSEAGKIDLNAAPAAIIKGLLQRASSVLENLDPEQARALADAIMDWRDADSRPRDKGAERRTYRAQGLAGPRDQPFLSVTELRQIIGMSREVFEFLSPLVSVNSQSARIDPRAAARDTLLAVPGLDEELVDTYLTSREQGDEGSASLALLRSSKSLLVPPRVRAYTIIAQARTLSGVRALRRAVVRLNRKVGSPIVFMDWSQFRQGAVVN